MKGRIGFHATDHMGTPLHFLGTPLIKNCYKSELFLLFFLLLPIFFPAPFLFHMLFKMVSSSSYRYLSLLSILLPSIVLAVPALDLETRATNAALPQSLQDCLKATNAQLSYPSDSNYGDLSKPENSALKASPAVIALPKHDYIAGKVVKCVQNEGGKVKISPRGGGHSYEAYSTPNGAVTLDLSKMNTIEIDSNAKTAVVGAGVRLGGLADQLAGEFPDLFITLVDSETHILYLFYLSQTRALRYLTELVLMVSR